MTFCDPMPPDLDDVETDTSSDACAGCGIRDVLDGPDPAAHWDSPFGTTIVAWTCSAPCSKKVDDQRDKFGFLHVV